MFKYLMLAFILFNLLSYFHVFQNCILYHLFYLFYTLISLAVFNLLANPSLCFEFKLHYYIFISLCFISNIILSLKFLPSNA